jgi:rhodanese-related sulfurtransferase
MLQNLLFKQPAFGFRERTQTQVKTITPTELAQRLTESNPPLVVDVRMPEEYSQDGHIAGSRLLPLPVLLQRNEELPQDREIVFVCRSGSRSGVACEQLANSGFENTVNMVGGMIAWKRAGLPSQ